MTKTQMHTPGPWKVEGGYCVTDNNGINILGETLSDAIGLEEHQANARLIASAPDLLEAVRALLEMITDNRTHGKEIDQAVSAILKAEGKNHD